MNDRELDKFYTKKSVIKKIIKYISLEKYDHIIEPSAGSGNFLEFLPKSKTVALDIKPEKKGIAKGDWFKHQIDSKYKNVLVVGNPPFGKFNRLSKNFLRHAFSFSNVKTVAFVLPNVYKKHTLQSLIPETFIIKKIIDLPRYSFELSGEDYHVPCSFFIFEKGKGKDLRQDKDISTNDFSFSNSEDYDFYIMGAAPKRTKDAPTKNNRGYYVKAKKVSKKKLIKTFKEMEWKGHSSANGGVAWFTKVDIIENYKRSKNENKR